MLAEEMKKVTGQINVSGTRTKQSQGGLDGTLGEKDTFFRCFHGEASLLFPTPTPTILSCATSDRPLPLSEPVCLAGKCP